MSYHPDNKLTTKNTVFSVVKNPDKPSPTFEADDLFADYKPSQEMPNDDLFADCPSSPPPVESALFANSDFAATTSSTIKSTTETWQMLIVDDEKDIHEITHLVLSDYVYQGRPLTIFRAYSAEEAKKLLQKHPNIAVIFLDVVMETRHAGLQLISYIRETLKNRFVRIILRTGQPGYAPEENVIVQYEINDYVSKTDLSRQKLITLTTASLRAYTDMMIIESYRQHLEDKVAERTQVIQEKHEELVALNRQLVKLNQEKNEFLGIAAHDLKNPLSAIQGLADLIQLSCCDEASIEESINEISEYAQMIAMSSQQMFELIKNLLDVNAIESGNIKISLKEIDLSRALQAVMNNYNQQARSKNIHLLFEVLEQRKYLILADNTALRQILDNLFSNAIKYSPPDKKVTVRLRQYDRKVRCEIQDEGPGFTEKDKTKLFLKFRRLSAQPTGGEHSTGLGLFIVKKLVEAMKGLVWCESQLGQGTTFIIEFPMP